MIKKTTTKKQFAKELGFPIEEVDAALLIMAEKGIVTISDYDSDGNPLEISLNADTEKEAKELLKKV